MGSSTLESSTRGLLGVVPLAPGAGFLLDTRLGAGVPPGLISPRIQLHCAPHGQTIEPDGRTVPLGRRSSLRAPTTVLRRARLAALVVIGVGFFGLLSNRRSPGAPQPRPRAASAAGDPGRPGAPAPGDFAPLEAYPDPVLVHRDGLIAWSNPTASQGLLRSSPFVLLGSRMPDWLEAGQDAAWQDHLRRLADGERASTRTFTFRTADGRRLEAEVQTVRMSFDGHSSFVSVLRPVPRVVPPPEREASAHHILDALDDGVLLVDRNGAVRETNARAAQVLGYSAVVLLRMDLATLCPPATRADLARLRAALFAAQRAEPVEALDVELRRRDGRALECSLSARSTALPGRVVVLLRTGP